MSKVQISTLESTAPLSRLLNLLGYNGFTFFSECAVTLVKALRNGGRNVTKGLKQIQLPLKNFF